MLSECYLFLERSLICFFAIRAIIAAKLISTLTDTLLYVKVFRYIHSKKVLQLKSVNKRFGFGNSIYFYRTLLKQKSK